METGPALPCFPKDFSVFFPFLLFLKRGSPGTGRAWFDPRAAAQPGTAALHRGQRLGGAGEGLPALLGEKSLPGETGRGWDEGGTLGRGMEPQLCQSGTPTRSGAGEGAHPNSLMPSRASQGAGMSQPHPASPRPLLGSPPRPGSREAPWDAGIVLMGWQPGGKDRPGLQCGLWKRAIFSHLSF